MIELNYENKKQHLASLMMEEAMVGVIHLALIDHNKVIETNPVHVFCKGQRTMTAHLLFIPSLKSEVDIS